MSANDDVFTQLFQFYKETAKLSEPGSPKPGLPEPETEASKPDPKPPSKYPYAEPGINNPLSTKCYAISAFHFLRSFTNIWNMGVINGILDSNTIDKKIKTIAEIAKMLATPDKDKIDNFWSSVFDTDKINVITEDKECAALESGQQDANEFINMIKGKMVERDMMNNNLHITNRTYYYFKNFQLYNDKKCKQQFYTDGKHGDIIYVRNIISNKQYIVNKLINGAMIIKETNSVSFNDYKYIYNEKVFKINPDIILQIQHVTKISIDKPKKYIYVMISVIYYSTSDGMKKKLTPTIRGLDDDIKINMLHNNTNKPFTYNVVAIVCHSGVADSGHYICLAKRNEGDLYKYNDGQAKPQPKSSFDYFLNNHRNFIPYLLALELKE